MVGWNVEIQTIFLIALNFNLWMLLWHTYHIDKCQYQMCNSWKSWYHFMRIKFGHLFLCTSCSGKVFIIPHLLTLYHHDTTKSPYVVAQAWPVLVHIPIVILNRFHSKCFWWIMKNHVLQVDEREKENRTFPINKDEKHSRFITMEIIFYTRG